MSIGDKYDRSEAGIVVRRDPEGCVVPFGVYEGEAAEPSAEQPYVVRQVYGSHDAELLIQDPVLGAYLALIHTCGIQRGADSGRSSTSTLAW
jgi:hypothetical protein